MCDEASAASTRVRSCCRAVHHWWPVVSRPNGRCARCLCRRPARRKSRVDRPWGRDISRSRRIVWLLFHRALGCRNGGLDSGRHHGPSVLPPDSSTPFRNTPGPCGPGQFRDLQFAVSAVRHFGGNGIHPYVLVGASKLWTQSRTPQGDWTNNESVYPQGGIGLVIPLSNRLALV